MRNGVSLQTTLFFRRQLVDIVYHEWCGGQAGSDTWVSLGGSHEDMMKWWNNIPMVCARYLVASKQTERSGSVAAFRAVGCVSDDKLIVLSYTAFL